MNCAFKGYFFHRLRRKIQYQGQPFVNYNLKITRFAWKFCLIVGFLTVNNVRTRILYVCNPYKHSQSIRYLSVFKENVYSYCSLKPKIVCICIQQIPHIVQSLQQEVRRLVIQRPDIQTFPEHSFLTSPFISPVFCFVLFSMGRHTRKLPLEVPTEVFLFFFWTLFMLSHVVVFLCSCCPFALVVPSVKWYYFQVVPCSLIPMFRRSHVLFILWSLCLLFMSTLLYVILLF